MAKRRGTGVKVSYKALHKEMGKVKAQLEDARKKRTQAGLSVLRVNVVLGTLRAFRKATECQISMLEEF